MRPSLEFFFPTLLISFICLVGCDQKSTSHHDNPNNQSIAHIPCPTGTTQGGISIVEAWARPAGDGKKLSAAYLTICNINGNDDTLLRVASPAAEVSELHETTRNEADRISMKKVNHLPVPAGSTVSFQPGGHHVMLINLTNPLLAGDTFPLELYFKETGKISIEVFVKPDSPIKPSLPHHNH